MVWQCNWREGVVQDCRIDVILTDYCMPEMISHDLLKVVKEHKCLKSIPVVVMSSDKEPRRISSGLILLRPDHGGPLQFAAAAIFLSKLYKDYLGIIRSHGGSHDS
ncbi:two-component response regulator ORR9-like isoform X2 [Magnolia sinica]|nr:two-component response regulator ORR9-like isoform X2 [Magnolia sinica]XP_058090368.1 two-component response regulator ORR9-like isoform X2 [Magnolia sinica]XP_058090369.1 two-component response regulator ORR9-like isoform X2 [Magnolia sinica]XP_058090370.1 two-component response regulator ORR9-like isoform X2 [Magnolia sinica]